MVKVRIDSVFSKLVMESMKEDMKSKQSNYSSYQVPLIEHNLSITFMVSIGI